MYNLKVVNNYVHDIIGKTKEGDRIINSNLTVSYSDVSNVVFIVFGMGDISFIDLKDEGLEGHETFPTESMGVLIRATTSEAHYRYDGTGQLTLTIDKYGTSHLTTDNGTLVNVRISELQIN
ncbi:hypothetical protein ACXGQW_07175 [Wenyingzhuangia sp. IMCC45533]